MTIPVYVLVLIVWAVVLVPIFRAGRSQGDYDFFSPMIGFFLSIIWTLVCGLFLALIY